MTTCLRKSLTTLQTFSRYVQSRKVSLSVSSMNLTVPQPDGQPKTFSPKIEELANNIAQLNLIEVAELSDLLKKKLNLPDAPAFGFSNFAAIGAAERVNASKEEEKVEEQINFTVKLCKFDEKQKVPLIKEIKSLMEDMNLVQAKKFVESAPIIIKENIVKAEAEKLKEALTKVGAEIEIS